MSSGNRCTTDRQRGGFRLVAANRARPLNDGSCPPTGHTPVGTSDDRRKLWTGRSSVAEASATAKRPLLRGATGGSRPTATF